MFACRMLSSDQWSKLLELIGTFYLWVLSKQFSYMFFIFFFFRTPCLVVAVQLCIGVNPILLKKLLHVTRSSEYFLLYFIWEKVLDVSPLVKILLHMTRLFDHFLTYGKLNMGKETVICFYFKQLCNMTLTCPLE